MRTSRMAWAASAVALLAGGALAQNVEIVPADEAEVVQPDLDAGADGAVDVVRPEGVVRPEPGEAGEAPVVPADQLVELDEDFVLPTLNLPVYALDDYDLVDREGEDVGEVEAVLGPDEQTATSVAVEFDGPGWFWNDGDVTRVVDISAFSVDGDKLVIDLLEDQARALPVYRED